jgi:hypothetical protein
MRRRPWFVTTALGVALCALLGSGLLAVVVDSGSAHDNTIESGEFHGVRYLEVAEYDNAAYYTCDTNLDWQADIGPQIVGDIDLDDGDSTADTRRYICARPVQEGTYKLKVGLRAISDSETGCSATSGRLEIDNDADTCGEGLGELSKVLTLSFETFPGNYNNEPHDDCYRPKTTTGYPDPWPQTFASLDLDHGGASTELCTVIVAKRPVVIYPHVSVAESATVEQRNAAQSDKTQFTLYFTLEPVEPEGASS